MATECRRNMDGEETRKWMQGRKARNASRTRCWIGLWGTRTPRSCFTAGICAWTSRAPTGSWLGFGTRPTPRPRLAQRRLAHAFGDRLARKTAFPQSPSATDAKITPRRKVRRRRSVDFYATRGSEPRCSPQFDEIAGNPKNGILNRVSRLTELGRCYWIRVYKQRHSCRVEKIPNSIVISSCCRFNIPEDL